MIVSENVRSYLDDFGLINCFIKKSFYNGISNFFYIKNSNGLYKELVVESREETNEFVKYKLSFDFDYDFSLEHTIFSSYGVESVVEVRFIVKKKKFDDMFYYNGNDLGAVYKKEYTTFKLWAPSAISVSVSIKISDKFIEKRLERLDKGVFYTKVDLDLRGAVYNYFIYCNGKTNKSLDPYGLSSTSNSYESVVVDLNEFNESSEFVRLDKYVDAIVYEMSIRDFTILESSNTKTKGYFDSLLEDNTSYNNLKTGFDYIKDLGVSHVQLMPVFDFVTVDEDNRDRLYNWGYDPCQYFSLEGSYSLSPNDPFDRISKFKKLVNKFHKNNIGVILDVVFNHIYDMNASSFEKCVPYYYFRYTDSNNISNGSFCGNDLDSRMRMFQKFILDCVDFYFNFYKIDGLRFDLMGIIDVDTMNLVYKKAHSINKNAIIYGEGWNMPTYLDDNMKSSIKNSDKLYNIGHFNDYFRDNLKGSTSDYERYDRGYLLANTDKLYEAASSLSANCKENLFIRFNNPNYSINYVESHDNLTCWDKIKESCKDEVREIRKQRHKLLLASVLLSQGVPFIQSGQEFLRTKLLLSNTYNVNDSINGIDWKRMSNDYDVVKYFKDLIRFRKEHKSLRLNSKKLIDECVSFDVRDSVCLEYKINYNEEKYKSINIIFNPFEFERNYDLDKDYYLLFNHDGLVDDIKVNHLVVKPYSLIIYGESYE